MTPVYVDDFSDGTLSPHIGTSKFYTDDPVDTLVESDGKLTFTRNKWVWNPDTNYGEPAVRFYANENQSGGVNGKLFTEFTLSKTREVVRVRISDDNFKYLTEIKWEGDSLSYTLLNNSSRGHSVPVVNGTYQCFGRQYASSDVSWGDDFFVLNLAGAYEKGCIDKINRSFKIGDNSVVLIDAFEPSSSWSERMVSCTKPELGIGWVDFDSARVQYDPERYTASYTSEVYRAHGDREDVTAYLVDFTPVSGGENEFSCEIVVK